MANLLNKYIYETYKSIIGIGQSGTSGVSGNLQALTDGEGHELPIKVSETDVELGFTTTKNIFIEAYGEVIDQNGNWTGPTTGLAGTSGTSGTSGHAGTSGTSGTSGHAGANGSSGTSGTSGRTGSSGVAGTSGTSGTSGHNGSSGVAGTSGTSGTSGVTGGTGTSGTSGIDGASGIDGTSGVNGTSGTSGVNGIPGTQNLIIDNINASVGTILPIGPYGVINLSAPETAIYQPDNAQNSIGIGYYGAAFNDAIYIGHYGQAVNNSVVVGHGSFGQGDAQSVIGNNSNIGFTANGSIIFGANSFIDPDGQADSVGTIVLGSGNTSIGKKNIVIASDISLGGDYNTIIGNATINGNESIAIGSGDPAIGTSSLLGDRNISFGYYNIINGINAIAIGTNNVVTANNAIALGFELTAETEDTLTIHKLQIADYATINFADDAAAATGGIPLGGVYHTSGILKIRIA